MHTREQLIQNCFQAWITKDRAAFRDSFATDAVYIESWGPAYRDKAQITTWFTDWTRENAVLKWDIKQFFHIENTCVCEWYFQHNSGGTIDGFDGVSIIEFSPEGKIQRLKEFQSKIPNNYPYDS